MSGLPFTIIDVCFVGILTISGILAYIRGFVREILAVAAWIGATFATLYGSSYAEPYAGQLVEEKMLAQMIAYAFVFAVSLAILIVIAHFIAKRVRESAAGSFDRSLGFVFGVLRGVILISLMYLVAAWYWKDGKLPEAIAQARTLPLIEGSTTILLTFVPKDARATTENATGVRVIRPGGATTSEAAVRALIRPLPKSDATGADQPGGDAAGYSRSERTEMQRLIESRH
jgi:membrane protein required for colicin V production